MKQCWRYDKLCACQRWHKLGIADVAKLLDSANQGRFTIQTMIFEPATLEAHISLRPRAHLVAATESKSTWRRYFATADTDRS